MSAERRSARRRFTWTLTGLVVLALWLSGVLSPPDPVSQLSFLVLGLLVSVVAAYWLTYREGWRTLGARSTDEVPFDRPLVFFGAFFLTVAVVGSVAGLVLPWGESAVAALAGVAFAAWVTYFGGYERLWPARLVDPEE